MGRVKAVEGWSERLTSLRRVRYLGSHPAIKGQHEDLDLTFHTEGIAIRKRKQEPVRLPWSTISRCDALSEQDVQERVSGTRVLLFGAFALLAKERKVVSFLEVDDAEGTWVFGIPDLTSVELRAGFMPIRDRFLPSREGLSNPGVPEVDVAARLRQLDDLLNQNLITDAEYSNRRSAILDRL